MSAPGSPQQYLSKIVEVSVRYQRLLLTLLTLLSLAYHVSLFFLPPPYDPVLYHWGVAMGLVLTVLALVMLALKAPFWQLNALVLSVVGSWIAVDMSVGIQAHKGVTMWMVLDLLLATLIVLAVLPAERSLWAVAGLYVGFVALAFLAGPVDPVLLLNLLLLMVFAAFLVLHGATISTERAQNVRLMQELRYDGLTGALTRQAIETELQSLLSRGTEAMLMLIDLDHFKQVNDLYGHLTGDRVLQRVAQTLQDELGTSGLVGRWGGEEFMALLPVRSTEQGRAAAERLRRSISELHERTASDMEALPPLTISVGAVLLRREATPNELVKEADDLLYAAKEGGRNRVMLGESGEWSPQSAY